jgi:hypothetical protein
MDDCGAARLAEKLGCARFAEKVLQPPQEHVEDARTIALHVVDFPLSNARTRLRTCCTAASIVA